MGCCNMGKLITLGSHTDTSCPAFSALALITEPTLNNMSVNFM